MKILFLALAFPKLGGPDSNLYTDLIEEFKNQGHEIRVVAPSLKGESGLLQENGVHILRVKTLPLFNVNIIRKGIANVMLPLQYKQAISKYFDGLSFDLIIMPTPPISLIDVACWLKKKNGCPIYLILRDIFPQNAADLGMMSSSGLIFKYFRLKEKKMYAECDFIGCLSSGNVEYVLCHNPEVDAAKLHLLPNWQKVIELGSVDENALRIKYGLEGKFVVIFGGNLGLPQKLENILHLADLYKDRTEIVFLIIGKGTEKNLLESMIRQMNLQNVILKDFLPRKDYQDLICIAQVGLISLNENFTIPNIPCKTLSYFNARIPVFAAVDSNGDYGHMIQEDIKAGLWAPSDNMEKMKSQLDLLIADSALRKQLGENGYNYHIKYLAPTQAYDTIIGKTKKPAGKA